MRTQMLLAAGSGVQPHPESCYYERGLILVFFVVCLETVPSLLLSPAMTEPVSGKLTAALTQGLGGGPLLSGLTPCCYGDD